MIGIGDHGPEVVALQAELKSLGYYDGDLDGQFGELMKVAVWNLQAELGIAGDDPGVVGAQTRRYLNEMNPGTKPGSRPA
ncbi:peptidoglycan-binding domain-containing protein [Prevotella lacticifex]|uniref:peptidoglycan-binding domain-containing protein n=1 Tax=Prevotella lacticifex TaxID=2854755 RepID=UPI001CC3A2F6|nr:peptidoglycan-binding domain-containing protein [Prevotella lacticifex]GJG53959.1 hypothetical protein PRLR5064_31810 [Prevotella lacticifex]